MTPKVSSVTPIQNKRLMIRFENDEVRCFDVLPYIAGSWYGELSDDSYFKRVQPAGRTVVWPNGQDIAPHELYSLSVKQ